MSSKSDLRPETGILPVLRRKTVHGPDPFQDRLLPRTGPPAPQRDSSTSSYIPRNLPPYTHQHDGVSYGSTESRSVEPPRKKPRLQQLVNRVGKGTETFDSDQCPPDLGTTQKNAPATIVLSDDSDDGPSTGSSSSQSGTGYKTEPPKLPEHSRNAQIFARHSHATPHSLRQQPSYPQPSFETRSSGSVPVATSRDTIFKDPKLNRSRPVHHTGVLDPAGKIERASGTKLNRGHTYLLPGQPGREILKAKSDFKASISPLPLVSTKKNAAKELLSTPTQEMGAQNQSRRNGTSESYPERSQLQALVDGPQPRSKEAVEVHHHSPVAGESGDFGHKLRDLIHHHQPESKPSPVFQLPIANGEAHRDVTNTMAEHDVLPGTEVSDKREDNVRMAQFEKLACQEPIHRPQLKQGGLKVVDEGQFDAIIYGNAYSGPRPPGIMIPTLKPRLPSKVDISDRPLYMHFDPRIHWNQPKPESWYTTKMDEISRRPSRKENFGRAAERLHKASINLTMAQRRQDFIDTLPWSIRDDPKWFRARMRLEGYEVDDKQDQGDLNSEIKDDEDDMEQNATKKRRGRRPGRKPRLAVVED